MLVNLCIVSILCFLPVASAVKFLDEGAISDSSIMGDGFGLTSGSVSSFTSSGATGNTGYLIPPYTSPMYTSSGDAGYGSTPVDDYLSSYTSSGGTGYGLTSGGGSVSHFTSGSVGSGIIQDLNPYAAPPGFVYSGTQLIPWNQFIPANSPMLWAFNGKNYERKVQIEIGGILQEIINLPTSGNLVLYEIYPDLSTATLQLGYAHSGWHTTKFFADKKGVHISIVTLNGVPSNAIFIQVL